MQSLSIIGHPGGRHATAQQLFAHSPFQALHCADLDHEQTLQAALTSSSHTLLVYCPPGLALAQTLKQNSHADCNQALQHWSDTARALLRHYMLNQEQCTLVNELALLHTPNRVLAALASKTGQGAAAGTAQSLEQTSQPLLEALGTSLAYTDQQSCSLYRDLETVADVSGEAAVPQYQANLREAFQNDTAIHTKLQGAANLADESTQKLQQKNDQLLQQLEQVQKQLEQQKQSKPAPAAGQPHERVQELQEENELLLLQLHQVQEELEHYFCEYQKLSATGSAPSPNHQQAGNTTAGLSPETLFDLKNDYLIGDNWYDAEHDGRWAGPGTSSTLTLPNPGQGHFELTLDIVHALDPSIVKNMQVLLNDAPLKLTHKFGKLPFRRFPCQVRAHIDTTGNAPQTPWQLQLRFPKTASPAAKGSDDMRQLAIRLRTIRVRALTTSHQS